VSRSMAALSEESGVAGTQPQDAATAGPLIGHFGSSGTDASLELKRRNVGWQTVEGAGFVHQAEPSVPQQ